MQARKDPEPRLPRYVFRPGSVFPNAEPRESIIIINGSTRELARLHARIAAEPLNILHR